MRRGAFILLAGLGLAQVGCAGNPGGATTPPPAVAQQASVYDGAVAASLVYTPPIVAHGDQPEFSRDGRAAAAYAGFDDVITTYYYLYQDDRQLKYGGQNHDRFERQAITQRVGVSYR
jgi:hypothetical protein